MDASSKMGMPILILKDRLMKKYGLFKRYSFSKKWIATFCVRNPRMIPMIFMAYPYGREITA